MFPVTVHFEYSSTLYHITVGGDDDEDEDTLFAFFCAQPSPSPLPPPSAVYLAYSRRTYTLLHRLLRGLSLSARVIHLAPNRISIDIVSEPFLSAQQGFFHSQYTTFFAAR